MMRQCRWFFGVLLVGFASVSSFAQVPLYWEQVTDSAPWGERLGHTTVSFQDKLWLIGGSGYKDVWYSEDGENWTLATASGPWRAHYSHTSVVYDGKIWVIGGCTTGPTWVPLNDVWYSTNGTQWFQATSSAPWSARTGHSSVTHDGKMWVIFGSVDYNYYFEFQEDVWYSTNGTAWTRTTESGDQRYGHSSVVYAGSMWVLGGDSSPLPGEEDYYVRSSLDGVDWIGNGQSPPGVPWTNRWGHTSVVHDGKIWLLGGFSCPGEVWCAGMNAPPVTGVAEWEDQYR